MAFAGPARARGGRTIAMVRAGTVVRARGHQVQSGLESAIYIYSSGFLVAPPL